MENRASAAAGSFVFDAREIFQRVLVPVDFFEGSRRAVAVALDLRERYGSDVHLFRLTESSENEQFLAGVGANTVAPGGLRGEAESRLVRFVDNLFPGRSGEVKVHAQVGTDVANEVASAATNIGATLVVIGAEASQTLLRTHVEKLVRALDTNILLLRVPHEVSPGDQPA